MTKSENSCNILYQMVPYVLGRDNMEDSQIVDLHWERSENAMNKHPRNMGTHTIFWNTKLNPHYYSFA